MARALKKKPDETPGVGHNSDGEEQGRVQFLSVISQYDAALSDVEAARGPLKAAQKKVSSIVGLAKSLGIPKWRLEARHNEMQRTSFENAEHIAAEARERRWAGIITPEQLKMHTDGGTPEEVRDATDWRADGYRAGVLNRPAELPDGLPTRHTQDWLGGHEDGRKSYMLSLAAMVPKPKGMTAEEVAAKADADFKADNPEVDIEAEAKKLKKSGFMERGPADGEEPVL